MAAHQAPRHSPCGPRHPDPNSPPSRGLCIGFAAGTRALCAEGSRPDFQAGKMERAGLFQGGDYVGGDMQGTLQA